MSWPHLATNRCFNLNEHECLSSTLLMRLNKEIAVLDWRFKETGALAVKKNVRLPSLTFVFSAHPLSDSELVLTYVVQFNDEEVCKDWYQQLQKQIRLLSAASMPDLIGAGNAINGSSSSSSLTTTSPPSGSSSSSISSPQSSSSVSSSVPPIIGKPPVGLGKPPHPPTTPPPPVPPLPQHRPFIPGTPSRQVLLQNASTAMLPRRGSFWSDKILTAHAPHRPESGSGVQSSGSLDPNEDIQLLNVIDAYYRKIPGVGKDLGGGKTRKLSSSSKLCTDFVLQKSNFAF